MIKKKAGVKRTFVDPETMSRASIKANQTSAYYYGNMGDSVERRLPYDVLGGGGDLYQGSLGNGSAYPSIGFGNFYGAGLGSGPYNRTGPWGGAFGSGGFQFLRRFSGQSAFNHSIIASCIMAYLGYGVVRNIIDLYADFATSGLTIDHPNDSVKNFYRSWANKVKLNDRIHTMFINYFAAGNVFIHRQWAKLSSADERAMKRADASESQVINNKLVLKLKSKDITIDAVPTFIDWYLSDRKHSDIIQEKAKAASMPPPSEENLPAKPPKGQIPWGYTCLNPLQMELRGKKIRGQSYWIMALDKNDTVEIANGLGLSSNKTDIGNTQINIPKEFVDRITKYQGSGAGYVAEIKLTNSDLCIVQDRKFDWFDWSVPFVYPALKALDFKDCLRNMEMKACQSVINSIFLFKLGNIEKGMPAEDEHFERLADILQQPGQAMNLIWNEAIEAEVIQADVSHIFDPRKHESADKDILTAIGVPEVLLGGKGGNFSNSYIAVSSVLEKLETARNKITDWLMGEFKLIAEVMGFQKLPTIQFAETALTDKNAAQNLIIQLFDRNIVSADRALREFDTDFDTEMEKIRKEIASRQDNPDSLKVRGPYIKDPTVPGVSSNPKTANGRPPGSSESVPRGKQTNPRSPVGQGIAVDYDTYENLLSVGRSMLDTIEKRISDRLLKAKGLRYIKQFPEQERNRVEELIYNVFSHMPAAPKVLETDDFLFEVLQSDAVARIKADVFEKYHKKLVDYETRYGKQPTKEMRRSFIVSAWSRVAIDNIKHI